MNTSQTDRCGYIWPGDYLENSYSGRENCCYRRTLPDSDKCAWHTAENVTIDELEDVRAPQKTREHNSPIGELIDGPNLSNQNLSGISLENVSLRDADFSQAVLRFADLSNSDLRGANFSGAEFRETSFKKSDLRFAKLPVSGDHNSPIAGGDFSGADLRDIVFPDNLKYASFEKSFIFESPIDFDPGRGLQNRGDILELEDYTEMMDELPSDYFGPPTSEPGRSVCMKYWPNINVGQASTGIGWTADFSGKNLLGANLSGAHLWHADFSNAFLEGSNFSDAVLWMADFSDANLRGADLNGADLRDTDLMGADLRDADLTGADLRRADVSDIIINGNTKCSQLYENSELSHDEWNSIARAYHDLKKEFSENGLIGKARNYHALQRRSRGLEAKARGGWKNSAYLGSKLSGIFTGYGVRIQHVVLWMLSLFIVSTVWYTFVGVEEGLLRNVTFSVITFTTSPPTFPSGMVTQVVAMVETFFGTLLVVLLGYILGIREQF